jgi:membrane fusion protein, multidrug efflux system
VDAYSRDDQTKLASGTLQTIDNEIDQTTGTGKLKAVFDNKGNELWPDQFVNIHLLLETRKNAVVMPSAAVQQGPQGSFVYLVKPDKTVTVRQVSVGAAQGNVVQITSGVAVNDVVVTDGQDKLQENSKVEAHQQAAPKAAQNAASGNPNSASTSANPTSGNPGPGNGRRRNPKGSDSSAPKSGTDSQ